MSFGIFSKITCLFQKHMFLRVGKNKERNVRVGDEVNIRSMPGEVPRSRVDPTKMPIVAAIRQGSKTKLATVKYTDSEDGEQHLVELPPSSLRAGGNEDKSLMIGDHIVLRKRGNGVLPSVGSEGKVIGGGHASNHFYTITFEMTHDPDDGSKLEFPITVTQDGVPRDMLLFQGQLSEDDGDEMSDDSNTSDDESDDYVLGGGGGEETTTLNPSSSLVILRQRVGREVRNQIMQVLSIEELEDLATRMDEENLSVKTLDDALKII
jgi:hypothetical protein